jgi:hypothetical protein
MGTAGVTGGYTELRMLAEILGRDIDVWVGFSPVHPIAKTTFKTPCAVQPPKRPVVLLLGVRLVESADQNNWLAGAEYHAVCNVAEQRPPCCVFDLTYPSVEGVLDNAMLGKAPPQLLSSLLQPRAAGSAGAQSGRPTAPRLGFGRLKNLMKEANSCLRAAGVPFHFDLHGAGDQTESGVVSSRNDNLQVSTLPGRGVESVVQHRGSERTTAQQKEKWAARTITEEQNSSNTEWRNSELKSLNMHHRLNSQSVRRVIDLAAQTVHRIAELTTEFAGYHGRRILQEELNIDLKFDKPLWRVMTKLVSRKRLEANGSPPPLTGTMGGAQISQQHRKELNKSAADFYMMFADDFPWPSRSKMAEPLDAVCTQLETNSGNIMTHSLFAQQRAVLKMQLQGIKADLGSHVVVNKVLAMIKLGILSCEDALEGEGADFALYGANKTEKQSVEKVVSKHREFFPVTVDKDFKLEKWMVQGTAKWKHYSWMLRYFHWLLQEREEAWLGEQTRRQEKNNKNKKTQNKTDNKKNKTQTNTNRDLSEQCKPSHDRNWTAETTATKHASAQNAKRQGAQGEQSKHKDKLYQTIPQMSKKVGMVPFSKEYWRKIVALSGEEGVSEDIEKVFILPESKGGVVGLAMVISDGVSVHTREVRVKLSEKKAERKKQTSTGKRKRGEHDNTAAQQSAQEGAEGKQANNSNEGAPAASGGAPVVGGSAR